MERRREPAISSMMFDVCMNDVGPAEHGDGPRAPPRRSANQTDRPTLSVASAPARGRRTVATVTDVTVRQLQYVVAVANTRGFHKAAAKCHVSQPALSAQVRQFEALLGVTLFERNHKGVIVTAAGEEVVSRARRVLHDVDELLMSATRVRNPLTGTLRIGIIPTIAPYLLPEVTLSLSEQFPKLSLVYREERTADAVRLLEEGTIDAAIVALEADLGDCQSAEIARDDFVAAMPKGHPLARKKALTLSDLDDVLVLLLEECLCFRDPELAACAKARARECAFRATSLATLAQMVSTGAGIALLPTLSVPVENRRAQLEIRPFVAPAPARTIGLAWRPSVPFGDALRELAAGFERALSRNGRGDGAA